MLYGKSATDAALASQGDDAGERSLSPNGRKMDRIPELTREFFDSPFFRRFLMQREGFLILRPLTAQGPSSTRWTLSRSTSPNLFPVLLPWALWVLFFATVSTPGASPTASTNVASSMWQKGVQSPSGL